MSRTIRTLTVCLAAALALGCTAEGAEQAESPATEATLVSSELAGTPVRVYKAATCGCCGKWVEHLRMAGFTVEVVDTEMLDQVKTEAGVPRELRSCHTALVGDYVFEGHVPVEDMVRFLEEKPASRGLAVPGMPVGSPGMEIGDRVDPFDVMIFDATSSAVYSSHR